jgi:hypothetical protein
MRAIIVHFLAVVLIAILAIGWPAPAKADCAKCHDCRTEAPAKSDIPCPEKGLVCQISPTCASQMQKAPAQFSADALVDAGEASFGPGVSVAINSAYLTPETAPPRGRSHK